MAKFNTNINDGEINKSTLSVDKNAGFIFGSPEEFAGNGLAYGETSVQLSRVEDAEALGLTAAFDAANKVLIYHHLYRHFKRNAGSKVNVMLVPQGTSLTAMADKVNPYLFKLIKDTEGKARTIGLVLNPDEAYVPTLAGGFDEDVTTAIVKAQATLDEHAKNYRRPIVIIEGRQMNGTAAAMGDLRLNASGGVGVTAIADPAVWALDAHYEKYAAVGDTVGMISLAGVAENIGWPEKFNLYDKVEGFFLEVGFSDGKLFKTRETEVETLYEKGVIFGMKYPQQDGVYFYDMPSCQALDSDYSHLTETRTMNKAIVNIYSRLFPKLNAPIRLDASTGKIDHDVAASYEAEAQNEIDIMENNDELSGGEAYIDPENDVRTNGLIIKASLVNLVTGRELTLEIGYTKNLS